MVFMDDSVKELSRFKLRKKVYSVLTIRERKKAILLIVLMIGMALMEVAGVVSIAPFLSVLGNPDVIKTNSYLFAVYNWFGFTDYKPFLMGLGGVSLITLCIAAVFRVGSNYALHRFVNMRRHSIGSFLLRK